MLLVHPGNRSAPRGAGETARSVGRQRIRGRLEHRHGWSGDTAARPRSSGRVPGSLRPEDQQGQECRRPEPPAERGGGSEMQALVAGP